MIVGLLFRSILATTLHNTIEELDTFYQEVKNNSSNVYTEPPQWEPEAIICSLINNYDASCDKGFKVNKKSQKPGDCEISNLNTTRHSHSLILLKHDNGAKQYIKKKLVEILFRSLEPKITDTPNTENWKPIFSGMRLNDMKAWLGIISLELPINVTYSEFKTLNDIGKTLDFYYNYTYGFTKTIPMIIQFSEQALISDSDLDFSVFKRNMYLIDLLLRSASYLLLKVKCHDLEDDSNVLGKLSFILQNLRIECNSIMYVDEQRKFCLENISLFFDIYILHRSIQHNLVPREAAYFESSGIRIKKPAEKDTKSHDHKHRERVIELVYSANLESEKHIVERYKHMNLTVSMLNCNDSDEFMLSCIAFVDNLIDKIDYDFTRPYYNEILKKFSHKIFYKN